MISPMDASARTAARDRAIAHSPFLRELIKAHEAIAECFLAEGSAAR
jgi:hypothetical protein